MAMYKYNFPSSETDSEEVITKRLSYCRGELQRVLEERAALHSLNESPSFKYTAEDQAKFKKYDERIKQLQIDIEILQKDLQTKQKYNSKMKEESKNDPKKDIFRRIRDLLTDLEKLN